MNRGTRAFCTRWLAGVTLVALLTACATVPTAPPDHSYSGRFSAVATQGDRREAVAGRFTFEIRGPHRTIDLATPLGTTVARIEVGPQGARATGSSLAPAEGPDADALAERLLGWRLPVGGLADWIEGRPAPGRPAQVERREGDIASIEQDGWAIRIAERFQPGGRPRLIVFERAAAPLAPAVLLRLVLDDPAG